MQITKLKLVDFRNYDNLDINFSPTKNLIIGKNGTGKTNLIEAIYTLALTKSFRGSTEDIVIKKDKDLTFIEGEIDEGEKTNYRITISNVGKKAKINNRKQEKLSDYISKINIILFNPDDLKIIKSSPINRRKMLNIEISQLDNSYLKILNDYNRILKQRNSYLKTMYINNFTSKDYLDILTDKIVELGEKIYHARKQFLESINKRVSDLFYKITKEKNLSLKYISDFEDTNTKKILKKYKDTFNKDLILGQTQVGIHRDDFQFILNGDILKEYGSEGQQKNAILAFKLAEIEIFKNKKKNYPILILDDLFSEIDSKKINNILKLLNKEVQTFITATDLNKVNKKLIKESKIFKVIDGKVEEKI